MTPYLEISRPAFSSFLKAEVAEFAHKTIDIVNEKDPEALLISPVFEPLNNLKPEINLLTIRYGMDPHRAKVELLKSKLMLTVSSLKLKVRLLSKGAMDEDLHTAKNFINTYLRYLNAPKKNDKVVVQQVQGFINELETNAMLSKAIVTHELMSHVNSIEGALQEYREAINTRLEFRAKRPTINTSQIVAKVKEAVHTLFKGIEVAQLVNSELDHEPLADELNELVSNYRLSARLRTAYNKRKAKERKENAPDEGNKDEQDIPLQEGNLPENGDSEVMPTSTRSSNNYLSYPFTVTAMNTEDDDELLDADEEDDTLFEDELDADEEFAVE